MGNATAIWSLLVAALLGFLVGLERERKREQRGSIFAGIRTFPLIALFGALCAQLSNYAGNLIIFLGLTVLGALLSLAYWRASAGEKIGGTSEVAALITFSLGVLTGLGHFAVAAAGAVIVTGILSARDELRHLSQALSRDDLYATVQFAAVSLVILPLVPNRQLGPWEVWNPHTIWLQVVLISGVSFVGYLASKLLGTTRSLNLGSVLGGLVSSTAVTLSYSRRSQDQPLLTPVLAVGVLLASAVMVPRLFVLLGVVAPELLRPALLPLCALFVTTLAGAALSYRASQSAPTSDLELSNPFQLREALQFALVFALVLLAARAAEALLGERGIYVASILAGFTRPDAVALTLGEQVQGGLEPSIAARGLTLAVLSNTLFKAGLAVSLGTKAFGRRVLTTLLLAVVVTAALAFVSPQFF